MILTILESRDLAAVQSGATLAGGRQWCMLNSRTHGRNLVVTKDGSGENDGMMGMDTRDGSGHQRSRVDH